MGLSLFLTSFIKKLPNAEHPWYFSFFIYTFKFCLPKDLILEKFFFLNFPDPAATKSLAIPLTPRQSALFGAIDKSITFVALFEK